MSTPEQMYEDKVKSLAEFCIISCINSQIVRNELNKIQQLKLISKGGDALNYYFYSDFIPTHDWDFGIVTIRNDNFSNDQKQFDDIVTIAETIGTYFATSLTQYFAADSNNVIHTNFQNLTFNYRWATSRLSHIMFNYYLEGVQHNNSLVDIHITDAVEQGVINRSVPANIRDVINLPDWIHKIESTDNLTLEQVINNLPNHPRNRIQDRLINEIRTNPSNNQSILNALEANPNFSLKMALFPYYLYSTRGSFY